MGRSSGGLPAKCLKRLEGSERDAQRCWPFGEPRRDTRRPPTSWRRGSSTSTALVRRSSRRSSDAYACNQREALHTFLRDGRIPIRNNRSERELRGEAVERKNWLFVGNDDAGQVNATFVTLIASCEMHGLEPWAYLRDLFCRASGRGIASSSCPRLAGARLSRTRTLRSCSPSTSSARSRSVHSTLNSLRRSSGTERRHNAVRRTDTILLPATKSSLSAGAGASRSLVTIVGRAGRWASCRGRTRPGRSTLGGGRCSRVATARPEDRQGRHFAR